MIGKFYHIFNDELFQVILKNDFYNHMQSNPRISYGIFLMDNLYFPLLAYWVKRL